MSAKRAPPNADHRKPGAILTQPATAGRIPFGINAIDVGGDWLAVTRSNLWVEPFAALAEFSTTAETGRRILVVPPLAGGFPYLLRDMVIGLLPRARVNLLDWRDARFVPTAAGRFGLGDNISTVIRAIRDLGPGVHVVGVCQGVVSALCATAVIAATRPGTAPRSLTLIGGPADPLANQTRVVQLLRAHSPEWFEANAIKPVPAGWPGEGRPVYPAAFHILPLSGYLFRHFAEGGELFWKFIADDGVDPLRYPFWALCTAVMDLPAEYFLETVRYLFHEASLLRGGFLVEGVTVDPSTIDRTSLVTFEGQVDDIAGPGQTHAAHDLCRSLPRHLRSRHDVPSAGHFSLFHGRKWRRDVLPRMLAAMARAEAS